jgi:hypothetical protein
MCYLDLIGLLNEALTYNNFIHAYRHDIINKKSVHYDINKLIDEKYTFIKFIINPYIRAVSIYRAQSSHNLSFRQYLKQLLDNKIDYFNNNDKFHYHPQYVDGEKNIITKYIKIDKNEICQITLHDGSLYILDVNKYTASHHGKKKNITVFCGDLPKNVINNNLPNNYKYFYDEEIKQMVETFYKNDIEQYNYSFNDFN